MSLPTLVEHARKRAVELDFPMSCEDPAGPLLATLAAAVPHGGRILELGTGAGVGTAWLVSGLTGRTDATVTTVELDAALADEVRELPWPPFVDIVTGDAGALLPTLGAFDLIFADALAGKWEGLDLTLAALSPGGVLIVDDMDLDRYPDPAHKALVTRVEQTLANHPGLVSVQLPAGAGFTIATRRRP